MYGDVGVEPVQGRLVLLDLLGLGHVVLRSWTSSTLWARGAAGHGKRIAFHNAEWMD